MTNLLDEVVPKDRWVLCTRCRNNVEPMVSRSGVHIRGDCPHCNRYIKFLRQVKQHPADLEPELYNLEELPW